MSDEIKDQSDDHLVCAFLDEELSGSQIDALLDQLECEQTRARACRQAMVGGVVHRRESLCLDISQAVRAAVQAEGPLKALQPVARRSGLLRRRVVAGSVAKTAATTPPRRVRWQVPASGFALAASVALAAVVIVEPIEDVSKQGLQGAAEQMAQVGAGVDPNQLTRSPVATTSTTTSAASAVQVAANATNSGNSAAVMSSPISAGLIQQPRLRVPTQLVAAGSRSQQGAPSGAPSATREWVIPTPINDRPIVAQWANAPVLASAQEQNIAQEQVDARMQQRLNSYLINHARYGGGSAVSGSLAYARVAARPQQKAVNE